MLNQDAAITTYQVNACAVIEGTKGSVTVY
jgi:hypothetical protein